MILTTVPDVLLVVVVMFAAGTATIAALTPVTLHELAKDDLARILEGWPAVAHELGCAMARRQLPAEARRTMPSLTTVSRRTV